MLNRKAHYWMRWRLTNKEEDKQAYKAYSVKCVQAIQAYYRECEMHLSSLIIWENSTGMLMGNIWTQISSTY